MSQRFAPGQPGQSPVPGQPRYQPPPPQAAGMRPYAAGTGFPVCMPKTFLINSGVFIKEKTFTSTNTTIKI